MLPLVPLTLCLVPDEAYILHRCNVYTPCQVVKHGWRTSTLILAQDNEIVGDYASLA